MSRLATRYSMGFATLMQLSSWNYFAMLPPVFRSALFLSRGCVGKLAGPKSSHAAFSLT